MKKLGVIVGVIALVGCSSDPAVGGLSASAKTKKEKKVDAGPPPVDAGPPPVDAGPPPVTGLCRLTGGGQILAADEGDRPDSFGGNAAPFRGGFRGEWNHVTHDGLHFHAHTITFVECTVGANDEQPPEAGFSEIYFEGEGTLNREECTFQVWAEDHGEGRNAPARDQYAIAIDCPTTDYDTGDPEDLLHGNLQIHPVPPGFRPR